MSKKYNKKIPAFLTKLYNIINDESNTETISWSASGTSFIIKNHRKFCSDILPIKFKTKIFSSFVRQLNIYNFHRTKHSDISNEFENAFFIKNRPEDLVFIKRKTKFSDSSSDKDNHKSEEVDSDSFVELDLQDLKEKTVYFTQQVLHLKKQNKALQDKFNILNYCKKELCDRNLKIRKELYDLDEKEKNLERWLYYLVTNWCPKMFKDIKIRESEYCSRKNKNTKEDAINRLFLDIRMRLNQKNPKVKLVDKRSAKSLKKLFCEEKGNDPLTQKQNEAKNNFMYFSQIFEMQSRSLSDVNKELSYHREKINMTMADSFSQNQEEKLNASFLSISSAKSKRSQSDLSFHLLSDTSFSESVLNIKRIRSELE